jgi:hypothetical protein
MRARFCLAALILAGLAILPRIGAPAVTAARGPEQSASTLDDQAELAVTVYNSDIALVRDVRNLQLTRGNQHTMQASEPDQYQTIHGRILKEVDRVREQGDRTDRRGYGELKAEVREICERNPAEYAPWRGLPGSARQ